MAIMREAKVHNDFQLLLLKLATQFINLPVHQFDEHIHNALKLIGDYVDTDRCYICIFDENLKISTVAHEWNKAKIQPFSTDWDNGENSVWFIEQLKLLKPVSIPDVNQLPPEATQYQAVLRHFGVKSCIDLPLIFHGQLYGYIGYESVTTTQVWSEETIALLEIVGEIYINALARRHAEQALIDKEKLQTALDKEKELYQLRSQLMSNITHEFRTPLAIIQTSAHTVKYHFDDLERDEMFQQLDRIEHHVEHLSTLFDDIILAIRAEKGYLSFDPELFDLKQFCEDVIETQVRAMKSPEQNVTFTSNESFVAFRGDMTLLYHILTSILSNAIKYSPEDGNINISLETNPDKVTVLIQDDGIGIPEQDQDRLFEPYFRASNVETIQGTGLGLKIVKDCVELHGGTIEVDSSVEQGTTFFVRLPHV